jgi:hypothetical protein
MFRVTDQGQILYLAEYQACHRKADFLLGCRPGWIEAGPGLLMLH